MNETTPIHSGGGCPYCSNSWIRVDHDGICPKVKSIEYYPDGTVKRVELRDESAHIQPSYTEQRIRT